MNRGLNKLAIFSESCLKNKYIELMGELSQKYSIKIFAYCIMDNHFHIALENTSGQLSQFMKNLNGHYGNYYRKVTKSKGYVFEDRFKSTIVQNEKYLITLIVYILQNPVRSGYVENPFDYHWSSINDYFNFPKNRFLEKKIIEELFSSKEIFFKELTSQYIYDLREEKVGFARYLGDQLFGKSVNCSFLEKILQQFESDHCIKLCDIEYRTKPGKKIRNQLLIILRDNFNLTYEEISKISVFSKVTRGYLPLLYYREKNCRKKDK